MKKLFLILFVCAIPACNQPDKTETKSAINITKTAAGYNIYSNKGILILEFTEQNCDSASLVTLDYIYETAKYFYNKQEPNQKETISQTKLAGI